MIGSILLKIIKGIVMKSGQASLKAGQEAAKKAGREFGKNHPAFQKFARLQKLLKIGSYLAFIIDFGGVLLIGFAMVLMLAIMSGNKTECETSTPEINLPDSNDNGKYSLEDISTFAKQGLTSSWGVSNTDAELLFLKTNVSVAAKYNLTPQNIKSVSQTISAKGVSPVFFWLYAINEGGGAGGFINHYGSGTGNATTDAERDAQYLVQTAGQEGKPATGGGEPADRCQVQSAYGNFLSSKVYQAGAHTFAITYHPDKKNKTTTQQISLKNLSKVNDGGSTQEDVLTTVIKPNQNVSGWTPPTFKSLVQSGTNYQIERLNQSIERKKAQIETKIKKIKQAQQSIRKISDQDKSNLTSDQLNANQTQLDALNGEVESQTTAIQTIKTSLETEEGNLEKAQRILKAIKTSSNDQEIADALG